MGRLTDLKLRSLKGKASEPVGSRGDGTLLFWRRPSKAIEAYFRYWDEGKETFIKIGTFKTTRDGHGFTLAECRDKAQDFSRIRREIDYDLKEHLEAQSHQQKQERIEAKRKQEAESSRGTFADLMEAYLADQDEQGKGSVHQTRQAFERNIHRAYPEIATKKARDVSPDDIVTILAAIHNRGSAAESVRVRALMNACFNFGMQSDYAPTRVGDKRFHIQHNPVSATKKNTNAVKVGDRVLSHSEVKQLWDNIQDVNRVGFVMGCFIRFMLATGGQRPLQLLRASWDDYDFDRHCVTLTDKKGKQGTLKIHVVPLSQRALSILDEVREVSGSYPWPFCSGVPSRKKETKGQLIPMELESLKNGFRRYNHQLIEQAKAEGKPEPKWFTARDIRRTIKNILIDAGVNREQRNLLQSHAQTGVDVKHYDRHEHLPEKRESMRRYDALLDKIIKGEDTKLVDLETYRQRSTSH